MMNMLRCQNCGRCLHLFTERRQAVCDFCGSNYILESTCNQNRSVASNADLTNQRTILLDTDIDEVRLFGDDTEYITSTTIGSFIDKLMDQLCSIAITSHVLKRYYKIRTISATIYDSWKMVQNYPWSSVPHIEIVKSAPYGVIAYLDQSIYHFESLLEEADTKAIFINACEKVGVTVSEEVMEKPIETIFGDNDKYGVNTKAFLERYRGSKYTAHRIEVRFPIITPEYFNIYFCDIKTKSEKIKELEVIKTITKEIENLFRQIDVFYSKGSTVKDTTLCYGFKYSPYDIQLVVKTCSGNDPWFEMGIPYPRTIWAFRDYGMSAVNDCTTMQAIKASIIGDWLEKSIAANHISMTLFSTYCFSPYVEYRQKYKATKELCQW